MKSKDLNGENKKRETSRTKLAKTLKVCLSCNVILPCVFPCNACILSSVGSNKRLSLIKDKEHRIYIKFSLYSNYQNFYIKESLATLTKISLINVGFMKLKITYI